MKQAITEESTREDFEKLAEEIGRTNAIYELEKMFEAGNLAVDIEISCDSCDDENEQFAEWIEANYNVHNIDPWAGRCGIYWHGVTIATDTNELWRLYCDA